MKRIKYKDELKSINPLTGKFYKRGDKREKDNRLFFCYKTPIRKKDGMLSELWLKPEAIAKHKKQSDKREKRYRSEYRANKFPNRPSPNTGKDFYFGEELDGQYFINYRQTNDKETGFRQETWGDWDTYMARRFSRTIKESQRRAKKHNIPHEIDWRYIKSIFPSDNKCPALGIKLQFGYEVGSSETRENSPSLDRIIPEKGYVKGNVVWISQKANLIKTNAKASDILKVAKWLEESTK
ncbi:MAG: hypothetical protein CMQ77_01030 [Gammaproteobacteria bacterium]|nr:hypothetical protein [Gammaproteobacteria bacterium]